MASRVSVPANLGDRVGHALTTDHARAGATTLRDLPVPSWGARLWLTAGVVAAAAMAVVFLLPPLDAPRTLSAAQILDRSLQTMSPASGTELREFDLELRLPRIAAKHAGTTGSSSSSITTHPAATVSFDTRRTARCSARSAEPPQDAEPRSCAATARLSSFGSRPTRAARWACASSNGTTSKR